MGERAGRRRPPGLRFVGELDLVTACGLHPALAHVLVRLAATGGDPPRRSPHGPATPSAMRSHHRRLPSPAAAPFAALAVHTDLAAPPTRWGNRMLAGHTFHSSTMPCAGPFVTTYFGVEQGVYEESIPAVPIPGFRSTDLASSASRRPPQPRHQESPTGSASRPRGGRSAVVRNNGQSRSSTAAGRSTPADSRRRSSRIARIEGVPSTQISARAQISELSGETSSRSRACSSLPAARCWRDRQARRTRRPRRARSAGRSSTADSLASSWRARTRSTLNASDRSGVALGEMFGLQGAVTIQRRVNGITFHDPVFKRTSARAATRWDMLVDFSAEWDAMSLHVPVAVMLAYELNARLTGTGDELDRGGQHRDAHPSAPGFTTPAVRICRSACSRRRSAICGASQAPRSRESTGFSDRSERPVRRDGGPLCVVKPSRLGHRIEPATPLAAGPSRRRDGRPRRPLSRCWPRRGASRKGTGLLPNWASEPLWLLVGVLLVL